MFGVERDVRRGAVMVGVILSCKRRTMQALRRLRARFTE
jgi:hypothetical protein